MLLPGTSLEGAQELAERLRTSLAGLVLVSELPQLRVTVSIGLTLLAHPGDGATQALARADQGLYRAKQAGRDRVEVVLARDSAGY